MPFSSDTGTLRTDGQTDGRTDGQICYINIARELNCNLYSKRLRNKLNSLVKFEVTIEKATKRNELFNDF